MVSKEKEKSVRVVVIMAGGSGQRFWPLSTKERPKQLLKLVDPERSLLKMSVDRVLPLIPKEHIFIATNSIQEVAVKEELKELPKENIVVEPLFRDTAAAIGYAVTILKRRFKNFSVAVLPSDHLIENEDSYRGALERGFESAEKQGAIVTLGVEPTSPETGYGYIEVEKRVEKIDVDKGFGEEVEVLKFCEKPTLSVAKQFLESGKYLWNGGIFIFSGDVMLEAFKELLPTHFKILNEIAKLSSDKGDNLQRLFEEFPRVSIDYGIMEHYHNIRVIPVNFGWSDIGSFNSFSTILKPNSNGSVAQNVVLREIESKNNIVIGNGDRRVSLLGVEGVIVVESEGELLICSRDMGQEIKLFFDKE